MTPEEQERLEEIRGRFEYDDSILPDEDECLYMINQIKSLQKENKLCDELIKHVTSDRDDAWREIQSLKKQLEEQTAQAKEHRLSFQVLIDENSNLKKKQVEEARELITEDFKLITEFSMNDAQALKIEKYLEQHSSERFENGEELNFSYKGFGRKELDKMIEYYKANNVLGSLREDTERAAKERAAGSME